MMNLAKCGTPGLETILFVGSIKTPNYRKKLGVLKKNAMNPVLGNVGAGLPA
jgi:hypothetical protein